MNWIYLLIAAVFLGGLASTAVLDHLWANEDALDEEKKKSSKRTSRDHHDEIVDTATARKSQSTAEADPPEVLDDEAEVLNQSPAVPAIARRQVPRERKNPEPNSSEEAMLSHASLAAAGEFNYAEFRGNRQE